MRWGRAGTKKQRWGWSLGGCVSRSFLSPSLVTPTRLRLFVWDGNGRSMRPVTSSVAHSRSAHSLMLHSCRSNRSKRSERRMRETRVNHPRWDKGRSFGPARRGWWTAMSDNHSSYDWAVSDSERRGSSVKGNGADERSPISSVNKESSFPPFTSLPRGRSGSRLMNLGSWLCRENHVIPTFILSIFTPIIFPRLVWKGRRTPTGKNGFGVYIEYQLILFGLFLGFWSSCFYVMICVPGPRVWGCKPR